MRNFKLLIILFSITACMDPTTTPGSGPGSGPTPISNTPTVVEYYRVKTSLINNNDAGIDYTASGSFKISDPEGLDINKIQIKYKLNGIDLQWPVNTRLYFGVQNEDGFYKTLVCDWTLPNLPGEIFKGIAKVVTFEVEDSKGNITELTPDIGTDGDFLLYYQDPVPVTGPNPAVVKDFTITSPRKLLALDGVHYLTGTVTVEDRDGLDNSNARVIIGFAPLTPLPGKNTLPDFHLVDLKPTFIEGTATTRTYEWSIYAHSGTDYNLTSSLQSIIIFDNHANETVIPGTSILDTNVEVFYDRIAPEFVGIKETMPYTISLSSVNPEIGPSRIITLIVKEDSGLETNVKNYASNAPVSSILIHGPFRTYTQWFCEGKIRTELIAGELKPVIRDMGNDIYEIELELLDINPVLFPKISEGPMKLTFMLRDRHGNRSEKPHTVSTFGTILP